MYLEHLALCNVSPFGAISVPAISCDGASRVNPRHCRLCTVPLPIPSVAVVIGHSDHTCRIAEISRYFTIFPDQICINLPSDLSNIAKMRPLNRCPVRCKTCNTTNARMVTTSGRRNSTASKSNVLRVDLRTV